MLSLGWSNFVSQHSAHLKSKEVIVPENAAPPPHDSASMSSKSSQQLIHELQVHQIELTMQNEELRQAHHALEESREQYFDLYDRAPVGYITLTGKGLVLEANLTAITLLGSTKRDLVRHHLSAFICKEDQDIYYLHINMFLRKSPDVASHYSSTGVNVDKTGQRVASNGDESLAWELRMQRPDGTSFWAHIRAIAVHDQNQGPVIRIVITDISKRKSTEDALKQKDVQLRATLESTADGILATDNKGQLLHSNSRFCELLNIPSDIISVANESSLLDFIANQLIDPSVFSQKIQLLNDSDAPDNDILVFKNGRLFETYSLPMMMDGVNMGRVWCFRDITAKTFAETEILRSSAELEVRVMERTAELKAANRELETFCYTISHDLMTPLRHLDGYAELLAKHCRDGLSDKGKYYVDTITSAARQMGVLIASLLRISHTGHAKLIYESVDLNQCVREVVSTITDITSGRNIEWVIGKLPVVNGDSTLLRQVFTNLIENAVKYTRTRKNARIEISASEDKEEYIFVVTDNGVGFDMKYAGKLFGVFQRMHRIDEYEGNGIGLATVQRIIARHGGRVWAKAELDRGAGFHFSLPKQEKDSHE